MNFYYVFSTTNKKKTQNIIQIRVKQTALQIHKRA